MFQPSEPSPSLFDFPPLSPTDFSSDGSDYGSSPFDFEISSEPWLPSDPNPFGSLPPEGQQQTQHDPHCILVSGFDVPAPMIGPCSSQTPSPTSPLQLLPASPPPCSPIPNDPLPNSPTSPVSPASPAPTTPVTPDSLSPIPISIPSTPPMPVSPSNSVDQSGVSGPLISQVPPAPPSQVKIEKQTKERKRKRNDSTPETPLPQAVPRECESCIQLTQEQLRTMSSEEYASYVEHLKSTQGLSSSDKKEIQRQKRLIRNREYAQKKRRSNKEKSESINQTVESQQNVISTLQDENSLLKSELHRLKSMLACILPPQQHHIIETPEPVLPIHATKKRRTGEIDSIHSNPSSPVGKTVLFVFLLCFGVTMSSVFFLPDGVVSSSLRGAGRGLLSESSPLSYPVGKIKEIFWPVVEPMEAEKTISTVDSSGLETANLRHELPKPSSQEETPPFEPFPGSEANHYMCDGMIEEVTPPSINTTTNDNSVASKEAAEVED